MTKFTLRPAVADSIYAIEDNPKLEVGKVTMQLPMKKKQQEKARSLTPQDLLCFHREMDGLTALWTAKATEDSDVAGTIKILPVDELLKDWKGVVYFDFTPEDSRIRYFRPIDFFTDECCVGAFFNEPTDRVDTNLYLYKFEGEPANLQLNMEGYLKMLAAAKGFRYWQNTIIDILKGTESATGKTFKEWMPQLFEDFLWENYVALYESARTAA